MRVLTQIRAVVSPPLLPSFYPHSFLTSSGIHSRKLDPGLSKDKQHGTSTRRTSCATYPFTSYPNLTTPTCLSAQQAQVPAPRIQTCGFGKTGTGNATSRALTASLLLPVEYPKQTDFPGDKGDTPKMKDVPGREVTTPTFPYTKVYKQGHHRPTIRPQSSWYPTLIFKSHPPMRQRSKKHKRCGDNLERTPPPSAYILMVIATPHPALAETGIRNLQTSRKTTCLNMGNRNRQCLAPQYPCQEPPLVHFFPSSTQGYPPLPRTAKRTSAHPTAR